jgi:hypothetical protein
MIKKILSTLTLALATIVAVAQTPAQFKFLGIPVDGKKSSFIIQLIQKGFKYDVKEDMLTGKFNGMESNIMVSENDGKVDRVYVIDENGCDEAQIRIRYNTLLQQFKSNEKYLELDENQPLLDDEDISYEMTVHSKTYEATFYFNPIYGWTDEDNMKMAANLRAELDAQIESGEYKDPTEEKTTQILQAMAAHKLLGMLDGQVWFRIVKRYGDYYIAMYYDNLKNRPNGEDL